MMPLKTTIKIQRKQKSALCQSWREVFGRSNYLKTPPVRKWFNLTFLGLLLSLPLLLAPANLGAASASINLSSPVISEGDDFSTRVLGLPWDMNTQPYPDFATVFFGVDRPSFVANGSTWSFTTTNNDPSLQLLYPGIKDCQEVLRLGDRFPIDTGKYNLLSFRLCSSAGSTANVHWFYDQFPATVFASSNFISISATSGSDCRVYVIDMNHIGVAEAFGGAAGWNGLIKGLRLDPVNTGSGLSLQMDWVRLTTADTSRIVPINWANVGSGTNLFFYLSKGSTCSTSGATLIGTARRTGSNGTFNWGSSLQPNPSPATPLPLPESFQPGQYAVFMLVDNTGPAVCAASALDIRKAPQLSFQKPSFFSGPDYATEVLGHPWSMDSPADVMFTNNLTSFDFTGGVFNGLTNSTGDSNYYMHVTTPIDTKRYKYLTFRYLLDGIQDIGMGWVHRFVWWWKGVGIDHTVTKDMIIYENWQTYSVDLSKALIEESSLGPGWTSAPSAFRMNPSEMPIPMMFHTDFVTLTGDEQVQTGVPFPIYYQTTPGSGLTISLFYDTDANPANGRTPINVSASPCPPPPSPQLNLLTGTCVMWDTSGVLKGSYFISGMSLMAFRPQPGIAKPPSVSISAPPAGLLSVSV